MSFEMICWYMAFILGLVLFATGIAYLVSRKGVNRDRFAQSSAFEFLAIWIMYLPDVFFNNVPNSMLLLKAAESVLTSLLLSINIILGNDAQRAVWEGHPFFSGAYMILLVAANIVLYLCVFGFLINFLEGPAQRLSMLWRRKRNVFVFSSCNEKTMAIAESIGASYAESGKNNDKCIVFTGISKEYPEPGSTLRQRLEATKAIRCEYGLEETLCKTVKRAKKIEVFLFEDIENDNLSKLSVVSECAKKLKKSQIRAFVELIKMPWDLMDDYADRQKISNLVVNFIRLENHFAYNTLLKTSVFENALPSKDGNERQIKFLLVGMNDRNLEMFKGMLHLCQMPGYKLFMMVIDEGESREKLRALMPEIEDECNKYGDAVYEIRYFENVDISTQKFEETIRDGFDNFTFAFVNVGDDFVNLDLAMRLNGICFRNKRKDGYHIQMCASDDELLLVKDHKLLPNIEIVGGIKGIYQYRFITMSDLEMASEKIHNVRHKKEIEGDRYKTWQQYCNNEFNRQSVYARTLSLKHKIHVIDEQKKDMAEDKRYALISDDEIWKEYEHMRWNVYTRTLGYCLADKKLLDEKGKLDRNLRTIAKVHNLLIGYESLPDDEKKKDAIDILDEVKALKGM